MENQEREWEESAQIAVKQGWGIKIIQEAVQKSTSKIFAPVGSVVGLGMGFVKGVSEFKNPIVTSFEYAKNGWYGGIEESVVVSHGSFRNPFKLGLKLGVDGKEEEKEAPAVCPKTIGIARGFYNEIGKEYILGKGIGTVQGLSKFENDLQKSASWKINEEQGKKMMSNLKPKIEQIFNEKSDDFGKDTINKNLSWDELEKFKDKIISEQSVLIFQEGFEELFEQTYFMKLYMKTPRISKLSDVIEDLFKVLPDKTHKSIRTFAENYKDDPIKAIMHIWTGWTAVTQPINYALMLDGYATFHCDYNNKEFIEKDFKKKYKHDYKTMIKHTIKFIRMVNYFIVKIATKKNIEDRITYRGVPAKLFKNMKVGQKFRVMNFQCTSDNNTTADAFAGKTSSSDENYTWVEFKIPKGCFNAGMIREYGLKKYFKQKETLIPPYTCCKLISKDGNNMTVEVAYDNKSESFTYFSF